MVKTSPRHGLRHLLETAPDKLLPWDAVNLARPVVDINHNLVLRLENQDGVVGEAEEIVVLLGLACGCLGELSVVDVRVGAEPFADPAFGVSHRKSLR